MAQTRSRGLNFVDLRFYPCDIKPAHRKDD